MLGIDFSKISIGPRGPSDFNGPSGSGVPLLSFDFMMPESTSSPEPTISSFQLPNLIFNLLVSKFNLLKEN
jgi:hypothetical protein